ncbi:Ig-like domain-containing protein, partial [Pseudomonas sp. JAI115]|uniref:Ig-like domain-containing protein n=1 Tax=Pseudomonas sp. JAI115 TaxID=2723061 RepID=UPI0016206C3E
MHNPDFGFFQRKTGAFRKTAFLCLALQFLSVASAVASPVAEQVAQTVREKNQKVAPDQQYVLVVPSEHETLSTLAARFAVPESSLLALHDQAMLLGWTGQALMVPRQSSGETRLYPAYVTYSLKAGETLSSVAVKVNRSEVELRRLNTLVLGEPVVSTLEAGEVMLIPAVAHTKVTKGSKPVKGVDSAQSQQDFETLLAKVAADAGNAYERQARNNRQGASSFFVQHGATTATNALTSLMSSSMEEVLSPYGRAKIGLSANARTNDVNLSVDYLHPIAETEQDILFAQVGARTFDNRNLGNVGVGYRRLVSSDLMLGANTFFDHDFTRSHTRAGVGLEMWGNTARLATNAYAPISPWKKSDQQRLNSDPNRMNLFERPAAGWDARGEAQIPGIPQLSATAQYFQWKGQGVDAFGAGKLKKDPSGHGVGLKWQPIPLLGFTSEHQRLQGGSGQFSFGMNLNWSFDRDLKQQLRSGQATALRPLVLAKQDFVDRNYNVVLNYKEQAKYRDFGFISQAVVVQANSPSGTPVTQPSPLLRGTPAAGIVRYELVNNTALVTIDPQTGVITVAPGAETQQVTVIARLHMPRLASLDGSRGVVEQLLATAGDVLRATADFFIPSAHAVENQAIPQNYLEVADANYHLAVIEGQLAIGSIELAVIEDRSPANGSTPNVVSATVWDDRGNPVADTEVSFTLNNATTRDTQVAVTDASGVARLSFVSQLAGKVTVTGKANSQAHAIDVHFIPDVVSAKLTLVANKDQATAGKDEVILTGTLIDENKNPVGGVTVGFDASIAPATDKQPTIARSVITDEKGEFRASLQSNSAGKALVTARIDGQIGEVISKSVSILFAADSATPQIISLTAQSTGDVAANGVATHSAIATVTDEHGNLLPGAELSLEHANTVQASVAATGADGTSVVTFSSTKAGDITLTAKVGDSSQSVQQRFVADPATPKIVSLTAQSTGDVAANGVATHSAIATVTDEHGNLLPGAELSLEHADTVQASVSATGADGTSVVTFSSTKAGDITLTAKIGDSSQSVQQRFVADDSTAEVNGKLIMDPDNSFADGKSENVLKGRIVDGTGNSLANYSVDLKGDDGLAIAATVSTNDDGSFTVPMTSRVARSHALTVIVGQTSHELTSTFVMNPATAKFDALTITEHEVFADGVATHRLSGRVVDGTGNALTEYEVTLAGDDKLLVARSVKTGDNGMFSEALSSRVAGTYALTATAGSDERTLDATFKVNPATAKVEGELVINPNNSLADGQGENVLKGRIVDGTGNALANYSVGLKGDDGLAVAATVSTNDNGSFTVPMTSRVARSHTLAVTVGKTVHELTSTFVPNMATATILASDLQVGSGAKADGVEYNTVTVKVTDAHGNAVPNASVSFESTNPKALIKLKDAKVNTDGKGMASTTLTSTVADSSLMKVTVNGQSQTKATHFIADKDTAQLLNLEVMKDKSTVSDKDGENSNIVKATVVDKNNNPLGGIDLELSVGNGAVLDAATQTTNVLGQAGIRFHNARAGITKVFVKLGSQERSQDTTFEADRKSARITVFDITKDGALANGFDQNKIKIKVQDNYDNAVPGISIGFIASNEAVIQPTAVTDDKGEVEKELVSFLAGVSEVTASVPLHARSRNLKFVPDLNTATVSLSADNNEAIANGKDIIKVKATAKDAHGNAVSGMEIQLAATSGTVVATVVTGDDGSANIDWISGIKATDGVLTASWGNKKTAEAKVKFIADTGTATILLVADKTEAVANGKDV